MPGDAVEAIRAGDTTDLFYLRLDGELLGLLREGFFPAIGSDALLAEAEGMAPIFRNVLVWDGQLLACAGAPAVMAWQAAEGAKPPPPTFAELAASHLMPWTREQYVRYLLTQLLMEEGDLPSEALAPGAGGAQGGEPAAGMRPPETAAGWRRNTASICAHTFPATQHRPGIPCRAIREYKCAAARAHGAESLRAQPQQPEPGGGPRLSGACRRNPPAHTRRAALA